MSDLRGLAISTLIVGLLVFAVSPVRAGAPYTSCSRSGSAGSWSYFTGQSYCGNFHLGYGTNGADRIRWYTNGCIAGRDMYLTYRHGFTRRSSCDTSADHWAYVEGGYSGNAPVNQQGSGDVDHTVGTFASYNWDDWLEIGSDGGPAAGTTANQGRFFPELDAVYAGKTVESYMYMGNVYQWRYLMSNPSQAYWSWGNECRFAHTGGTTEGPGWYSSGRVNNGPGTGPGGTMDLSFNMRPTTTGDYNEDFQMVDEWTSWFGDKVTSNGNMRTWTRLSRKAPGATDGWDSGGKKKGETVRFSVAGADSWGTGSTYSWDWDGTTAQGWYAGNACTVTQEDSNDRLRINVTGADPYCYSSGGLAINASTCKYLTIRMWSNGGNTAQLFWSGSAGGWSGDRHVDWTIYPDSQWHVYRVPLPASWSGTVYQIRLDPVGDGAASGQTVYVDWLRIHHVSDGLSGLIWLATDQSSWDIHNAAALTWDSGSLSWYKDYTLAHGYPQTYYACLRVQNDNSQQSDNHDRRFGGSGGGWGYRSYKVLNTEPAATNASLDGNPWTNDNTPELAWTYSDSDFNAQSNYRVQVDDAADFSSPLIDTDFAAGSTDSYTPGSALPDGQMYYRVGVLDGISQSGRNGTYTAGVSLGQAGGVTGDTAASFDGTDDHVVVPAFTDSFGSGMTIEFWAYPTASSSWARFLDFGIGPANENILVCRAGTTNNLHFEVYNGTVTGGSAVAAGALVNNEWHHYAVVLNSDMTVSMYRDGTALAVTGKTVIPSPVNRTTNYIGRSNWSGDAYYAGGLDELAIYDRPLTQDQIQAHYSARASAEAYRDLVLAHSPWGYWRFGESAGTTAANLNGGLGWSSGTGFKVDSGKPSNPSGATCSDGKASAAWRNTASPTFTLSGDAADSYSGLKDAGANQRYRYYFGTDSNGAPLTGTDSLTVPATPSGEGTYYLRVQTQDNAGNWSNAATVFVFNYDSTAPAPGPAVSTTANSAGVTINFTAGSDALSGLSTTEAYRVTRDGFDSGALTTTDPVQDAEALTELAEGQAADYTITTRDEAGNTSTSTISARRPLAGATWVYTTGASSMAAPGLIPNVASPAITGVFSGSNDYRLHGMAQDTGSMLITPVGTVGAVADRTAPTRDFTNPPWPFNPPLNAPMVFASSLDGRVYAHYPVTNTLAWATEVAGGLPVKVKPGGKLNVTMTAGPKVTQTVNLVVVGTYDNSLNNSFVALDMADGSILWSATPGNLGTVTGSPVISGTTAYFTSYSVSGSPSVWAVDLASGSVLWSRAEPGSISAAPSLSADGSVIYVGSNAGTVSAFSTADGISPAIWSQSLGDGAVSGALWPASGVVYVSTGSQVNRLSAATGVPAGAPWPASVSSPSTPVVGGAGYLYVGSSTGDICQINLSTAAVTVKDLGAEAGMIGDPVIGTDDGHLYVGASDGRIYKVAAPF